MKLAYMLTLPDDERKYLTGSFSGGDPNYSQDVDISGQKIKGATLKTYFRMHQYAPDDFVRSAPTEFISNSSGLSDIDFGIGIYDDFSLISEGFADLICAIEPNVHQFIEVKNARTRNGRAIGKKYYHFNITRCFNAIDASASNVTLNSRDIVFEGSVSHIRSMRINYPIDITLKAEVVGACHIWRGTLEDINRVFVSSALRRKMDDKKLKYACFQEVSVS